MERSIQTAIYPGNLNTFVGLFPTLIRDIQLPDSDLFLREKFELAGGHLKEYIENISTLFDTDEFEKEVILAALSDLYGLDPDRDYETFARNALPILKWLHNQREILRQVIQLPSSGNPYIYRRLCQYTLISNEDNHYRVGIEAQTLSPPLEYTLIQLTDGYDPVEFNFYDSVGDTFDIIANVIFEQTDSEAVSRTLYQISTKKDKTPRFKGGRPRNPDDEWAYIQVQVLGRKPEDVRPEWLERIGERANHLADPLDSFRKIIKKRRR